MNHPVTAKDSNKTLEGGIFYPTGNMLIGVPSLAEAETLRKRFVDSGVDAAKCTVMERSLFQAEAEKNLENPGVLASLGSAVHIRQTQLELAREGCHFLLVDTPDAQARDHHVALLAGAAVRYAVLYRTLVIEDLIHHIASSIDKEEAGAPGAAIG